MPGRPESTEAAPFYWTYIDKVPGDDALAVIRAQLDDAAAFFATIPEEKSLYRYGPGKWSIREVLSHITDTERAFVFRALWFARGFTGPLPGFDQNIAVAGAAADSTSWAAHVEEFRRVRLATISFFENLPADAWMKTGIASDYSFTVRVLAFIVPGHVAHHILVLRERYL